MLDFGMWGPHAFSNDITHNDVLSDDVSLWSFIPPLATLGTIGRFGDAIPAWNSLAVPAPRHHPLRRWPKWARLSLDGRACWWWYSWRIRYQLTIGISVSIADFWQNHTMSWGPWWSDESLWHISYIILSKLVKYSSLGGWGLHFRPKEKKRRSLQHELHKHMVLTFNQNAPYNSYLFLVYDEDNILCITPWLFG